MSGNPARPGARTLQQADLNGLVAFARLAETLNFTTTARQLGISPSAVSQAIRALEARTGATLVNRTTRQVGLTEAGQALLAGVQVALGELETAMSAVNDLSGRVTGTLRLNAPSAVAPMLWTLLLVPFSRENPDLEIEVHASDRLDTVFADGYDAGVRLGQDLDLDMVAFRLSEPFPIGIFAAPALLDEIGRPSTIADLDPDRCIRFRNSQGQVRKWRLLDPDGGRIDIMPTGRLIVDDAASNMGVAAAGGGFAYRAAPVAEELVAQGRLEPVLAPFCPQSSGLFLYYPDAARASPKLRALIGFVQRIGRYRAAVMPPSTNTAEPVR